MSSPNNTFEANFENNYENNFGIMIENESNTNIRDLLQNLFVEDEEISFLNLLMSSSTNSIFSNIFENSINRLYIEEEQYNSVLRDSFEEQSNLKKTNHEINLPLQKFDTLVQNIKNNNKECSIFLNEFDNDDIISTTKCNHVYHNHCIKEWGKYKMSEDKTKTECPMCRAVID